MARGYTQGRGSGRQFHPMNDSRGPRVRSNQRRSSLNSLPSAGIKHPGALTRHGYNLEEDSELRESALIKAVKQDGYLETSRRLTELETLNKNHAEKRHKIRMDLDFIRMHHGAISEGKTVSVS